MIDISGATGRLKAVYDYLVANLSVARAAKIDNLDAAISTRAGASTALSSATWTGTRAGYLDKIEGPTDAPPTWHSASSGAITSTSNLNPPAVLQICTVGADVSASVYTTTLSVSGRGVLTFAALYFDAYSGNGYMRIIIDGVTIIEQSTNASYAFGAVVGAMVETSVGIYAIPCEQIPFRTSLQIQIRTNGPGTVRAFWRYRLA